MILALFFSFSFFLFFPPALFQSVCFNFLMKRLQQSKTQWSTGTRQELTRSHLFAEHFSSTVGVSAPLRVVLHAQVCEWAIILLTRMKCTDPSEALQCKSMFLCSLLIVILATPPPPTSFHHCQPPPKRYNRKEEQWREGGGGGFVGRGRHGNGCLKAESARWLFLFESNADAYAILHLWILAGFYLFVHVLCVCVCV